MYKRLSLFIILILLSVQLFCNEKIDYLTKGKNAESSKQYVEALNYYWFSMEQESDNDGFEAYKAFTNLQKFLENNKTEEFWINLLNEYNSYYLENLPYKITLKNLHQINSGDIKTWNSDFNFREIYRYKEISNFLKKAFSSCGINSFQPDWEIPKLNPKKIKIVRRNDYTEISKTRIYATNYKYQLEIFDFTDLDNELLLNKNFVVIAYDLNGNRYPLTLGKNNLLDFYEKKLTEVEDEFIPEEIFEYQVEDFLSDTFNITDDFNQENLEKKPLEENIDSFMEVKYIENEEKELNFDSTNEEILETKDEIKTELKNKELSFKPFESFRDFRFSAYKFVPIQSNAGLYLTNEKPLCDVSISAFLTILPFIYGFIKWDFGINNTWSSYDNSNQYYQETDYYISTISLFVGPGIYIPITHSIKIYSNFGFAPFLFGGKILKAVQISFGVDYYPLSFKELYIEADISFTKNLIDSVKGVCFTVGIGLNVEKMIFTW